MKPKLAITLGEPAGIGPEIVAASLDLALSRAQPVIFGHWPTFERVLKAHNVQSSITISETVDTSPRAGTTVIPCGDSSEPLNQPNRQSADAQYTALEKAVDAVLANHCSALVTAPVAKAQIASVSSGFTGHTEYLATRSGLRRDDVTMVFASSELAVGLVSTHLPLRQAAAAVTRPHLERTVGHVIGLLARLRPDRRPRIGISAINPHGGEQGLLGSEERRVLEPFCDALKGRSDAQVTGPVPADALFRDALAGKYDGVVAAYHDQAMIPLKLLGPARLVNITMGLPFVRTSPDHGVAYDLARTGQASPQGMRLAIDLALRLSQ